MYPRYPRPMSPNTLDRLHFEVGEVVSETMGQESNWCLIDNVSDMHKKGLHIVQPYDSQCGS
jgi:hypothetical protein